VGKSADTVPRVVERYVAAQAARNFDTLVELFTDDAVVIDEGKTWRGKQEIRAWREGVASTYQYTTELQGVDGPNRGRYVARIRLEGNFPGGVVDLRYRFTVDNEQIRRLEIGT
jgi:ketosteroid isomerase-like protein